jgi:hypothetical protein
LFVAVIGDNVLFHHIVDCDVEHSLEAPVVEHFYTPLVFFFQHPALAAPEE